MISSAADYDFVQGITNNQVLINGQIMPWRDVNYTPSLEPTAKPQCLRGEDLCWLWEAAQERRQLYYLVGATGSQATVMDYEPKIQKRPFGQINSAMRYGSPTYNCWLSSISSFNPPVDLTGTAGQSYYIYSDVLTSIGLQPVVVDYINWSTITELSSDVVRRMFWDVGNMGYMSTSELWNFNDYASQYTQTSSWTGNRATTPTVLTDKSILLSETFNGRRDATTYPTSYNQVALQQQISNITLVNTQLIDSITKYVDSVSCIIGVNDNVSLTSIYGQRHDRRLYCVPVEISGNYLVIPASTLLQIGKEYKQHFGIKYITSGELTWPGGTRDTYAYTYIHINFMFPIFKMSSRICLDDIGWQWQPS